MARAVCRASQVGCAQAWSAAEQAKLGLSVSSRWEAAELQPIARRFGDVIEAACSTCTMQRTTRALQRATRSAELTRYACNMQHGTCNAQLLRAARLFVCCTLLAASRVQTVRGAGKHAVRAALQRTALRRNVRRWFATCAADLHRGSRAVLQTQRNASLCDRGCAALGM